MSKRSSAMHSDSNPRTARPIRTAGLAALLSAALLLVFIPAATARKDREERTPPSSQPTQSGESSSSSGQSRSGRGEAAEQPSVSTEASAPAKPAKPAKATKPEKPEKRSGRGATTGQGGAATGTESTSTTPASPGRRGGNDSRQEGSRDGGRRGGGRSRETGSSGQRASSDAGSGKGGKAVADKKSTEGGGSPESRRKQERTGNPNGSHIAKGKAKKIESARPSTLPSETPSNPSSSSSSSSPLSGAATVASAAAVASTPTAKASISTGSAPSIARRSAQHASRAKSARRTHSKTTRGGARSAPTGGALLPGTTAVPSAPVARLSPDRSAHAKAKSKAPAARTSPLVTTITRIVGVVPTPIKLLIGALVAIALAMMLRSRFAARRARRAEQQRSELLEDVGLLQAALLPLTPPRLGPVGTSAAYRPAAGPAAGGDFYDVFALEDGKLGVILGDVSGHGRKALPHTALLRFTLRAYLEAGLSPRGAVETAGSVLDSQLGGSFATVLAATYDPRERRLLYSSAGHPPPLIRSSEKGALPIEPVTVSSAPPIGIGMPTGTRETIVSIPGDAQICFFTDGVTEARVGGDLFGVERLGGVLSDLDTTATAADLLDLVTERTDKRPDDMAACLLHIEGDPASPKILYEELELNRDHTSARRAEDFLTACRVPSDEISRVMQAARTATQSSGSAVLEIRCGDAAPEVSLQQDNLSYLQTRHAARQADLRVSV